MYNASGDEDANSIVEEGRAGTAENSATRLTESGAAEEAHPSAAVPEDPPANENLEPPPTVADPSSEQATQAQPRSETAEQPIESQQTDELFVQQPKGFRRTTKNAFSASQAEQAAYAKRSLQADLQYTASVRTAIVLQESFQKFSFLVQGPLFGMTLAHAIYAFVIMEPSQLPVGYQWISVPIQATFFFCFTISAISALDRFEAGSTKRETLTRSLTLQRGSLDVIAWFTGSICSLVCAQYDESFAHGDDEFLAQNDWAPLQVWRFLSLARAICALIGWFLLAFQSGADYTRDRLASLISVSHPHGAEGIVTSAREEQAVKQKQAEHFGLMA